ncbi:MAG: hypothetical protein K5771_01640 [Oscillospiraceae bacterium]|nr:hypothetical protein [Oscillospiraceae bacterium]
MWKCKSCGTDCPDEHSYCMQCGASKPVEKTKSDFKLSSFVFGLMAAAVVFLAVFAITKWLPKSGQDKDNILTTEDNKALSRTEKGLRDRSLDEALTLYEKAVNYEINRTGRDYAKAFDCYKKAAELGNADAMAVLGWIYSDLSFPWSKPHDVLAVKMDIKPDRDVSVSWWKRSAEQGNPAGMAGLGVLEYEDFYNKMYEDEAEKADFSMLKQAAELNDPVALLYMGILYADIASYASREYNVDPDFTTAVEYFDKAAAQNDPYVMLAIAGFYYDSCYYSGPWEDRENETEDYKNYFISQTEKAVEYCLKGAEAGCEFNSYPGVPSYFACILFDELFYFEPSEVKKQLTLDMPWVLDLLNTLATENDPNAMYLLGLIHERGIYVKQDMKTARQWYDKAEKNGFEWY